MTHTLRTTGWMLMMLLASLIALLSLRYFTLNQAVFTQPLGEKFLRNLGMFLTHAFGGILALALGPWQFWAGLRNKHLQLHRWIGRLYLFGVLVGGIGGLYLATIAYSGLPTRIGFGMLGTLWLGTGAMAYQRIRQRDIERHREWMIRNYALTFAAVTLRLWLPLLMALGFNFLDSYITVAWFCWVPNLLVAELFIGLARDAREKQRVKAETARMTTASASPVQVISRT